MCTVCTLVLYHSRSLLTPSFLDRTIRAAVQQHLFEINPLDCPGVQGPGLRGPSLLGPGLLGPCLQGPGLQGPRELAPCSGPPLLTTSARQRRRQQREQKEEEEEGEREPERSRYGFTSWSILVFPLYSVSTFLRGVHVGRTHGLG